MRGLSSLPVHVPRPVLAGAVAVAVGVVAAACGTGGRVAGGDVSHGRQVFTTVYSVGKQHYSCATCHTLAAAGAQGVIGPNLDNAFSADRAQKFEASTIQQIVADQIRLPLQGVQTPNGPLTPNGYTVMPANIVKGKDLVDVSAFVALCAGNPDAAACRGAGAKITATAGADIFQQAGCGGCHTLKAAPNANGTAGPNLDKLKPPVARIVRQVTNGGAVMPSFKSRLSPAQIQAVATYVASVAGK